MGQAAYKLRKAILGNEHKRVLLVGPNGAGKTCLLYGLKLGFDETFQTMPTVGFNVETWTHQFKDYTIWDLGLRSKMRPLVKHYTPATDMVIFMLDGHHADFFWDAEDLFGLVRAGLEADDRQGVPWLFFMNKQDLPQRMTVQEICDRLKLHDLAQTCRVHLAPCCASTGEGVMEGMEFLTSYRHPGPSWFLQRSALLSAERGGKGLTIAPGANATASGQPGERHSGYAETPPPNAESPAPEDLKGPSLLDASELPDEEFLQAFLDRRLKPFGPSEMMRLAILKRLEGSTALATLELARLKGCVGHATRMHFWASRVFAAPLPDQVPDTRSFLEAKPELLPKMERDQEALIHQAYSEKIHSDKTWAHMVVPPDLQTGDDDASFWARVEHDAGAYNEELDSFCSLVRLAFILLKAMARRDAIKRMDALLRRCKTKGRPWHETRQYVALQFAHLALAQHPTLQEKPFAKLLELCPELCEEDSIYKYYSEKALAKGQDSFQAPDLQPLPSKLEMPPATWHEQLGDEEFLQAVRKKSLSSWGLPSLARLSYLYLSQFGRPQAVQKLLNEVEDVRKISGQLSSPTGLFAHETLAYFTIHMIHYFIASQKLSMAEPFSEVVKKCEKVVDCSLYRAYYSDQAIHCTEARTSFVLPDLCPLPDLLPSSV